MLVTDTNSGTLHTEQQASVIEDNCSLTGKLQKRAKQLKESEACLRRSEQEVHKLR